MSVFLYNIFLLLFRAGTAIASMFDAKAKKWVKGHKKLFSRLQNAIPTGEKIIWVHCASLGEFEQGRPVMEELKKNYPACKILLTFFSPSGYEAQKNYKGADWIFYLPLDGPRTAKKFLEIVNPSLVIFVKYEFWYYYLKKIKYRNIPLILISALFRKDMSFFKWYGGLQRKILSRFDRLFVQNDSSKKLLDEIGLGAITEVSGDTRFDRVLQIAENFTPIEMIEQFVGKEKTIVAGSTWLPDEQILGKYYNDYMDRDYKWIIAPHDISDTRLKEVSEIFADSIRYSTLLKTREFDKRVLIIDNIGMLSRLYYYATVAYVGGGFSKSGIHNVLEPAVYGKPVIFGPHYKKYYEAIQLINSGGAIFINGFEDFDVNIDIRSSNTENKITGRQAKGYILKNKGATEKIVSYIQEKRLLTS